MDLNNACLENDGRKAYYIINKRWGGVMTEHKIIDGLKVYMGPCSAYDQLI